MTKGPDVAEQGTLSRIPPGEVSKTGAWIRNSAIAGFALVVLGWSAEGVDLRPGELLEGIPSIIRYLSHMFPPNFPFALQLVQPTVETIQIAIWGTLLAVVGSLPLGILAASNLTPHPLLYQVARFLLNTCRGVSELVFALIFVAAVGLGPFPGVLALAVHNAGMLGKFYAEAIEGVDPGPIEALEAAGANRLQMIALAILPQVLPDFVAFNLYRFEVSIRSATVLGLVGAGGIGFHLISSIRLFQYQDTAVVLIMILAMVVASDRLSSYVRSRII
jgi:phosphonate transport system permease protein